MSQLDWRSAEDYTFTEKLDGASWSWEFLRRNQEYVKDWLIAYDAQKQFDKVQSGSHFNIHRNPYAYFFPPVPPNIPPDDWVFNDGVEVYSPAIGYGKKWRIKGRIQDPENPASPAFEKVINVWLLDNDSAAKYYSAVAEDSDVLVQNGMVAIMAIDLTQTNESIKECVNSIISLERKRRDVNKNQTHFVKKENWVNYLRILDAKIQGASHSKIGLILFPELAEDDAKSKVSSFINTEIPRLFDPDVYVRLANS